MNAPRLDVIRGRHFIDEAIDCVELAQAKLKRAGMDTTRLDRVLTELTKLHVTCSEVLR